MDNGEKNNESHIYIEFEDVNSVNVTMFDAGKVTPMQMLAIAKWLEWKGTQMMAYNEMQQAQRLQQEAEMKKIIVPKPKIQ